jgi:copper resistance protein B
MRTDIICACLFLFCSASTIADSAHESEHGNAIFHAFTLQADAGEGRDDTIARWDFDGWLGSDENKLWLKAEGENVENNTERNETWALYSRNIATFWDLQAGLRYDTEPESTAYFVAGFNGLAPWFFDSEAHLFISDEGDFSFRLHEENDFLLTQKLVLKPYGEVNIFAQDVKEVGKGSGLSNAELGLQLRYEILRKFAPYLDMRYEKLFGETESIASDNGERSNDLIVAIGIQLVF